VPTAPTLPPQRLARVLWNDPGTGVMRHADAGYDIAAALRHASKGMNMPMYRSTERYRRASESAARQRFRGTASNAPWETMTTMSRTPASSTPGRSCRPIHAGVLPALSLPESACVGIAAASAGARPPRDGDAPVYGVNTGFGKLASKRIDEDQLDTLQRNLIRSHSVGVGEPLPAPIVRLMLADQGCQPGARLFRRARRGGATRLLAVLQRGPGALCALRRARSAPRATWRRSSHMTLALMGEGDVLRRRQARAALPQALQAAGIAPLTLAAKEGLALINGTQTSTALALHALLRLRAACWRPRWSLAR